MTLRELLSYAGECHDAVSREFGLRAEVRLECAVHVCLGEGWALDPRTGRPSLDT